MPALGHTPVHGQLLPAVAEPVCTMTQVPWVKQALKSTDMTSPRLEMDTQVTGKSTFLYGSVPFVH